VALDHGKHGAVPQDNPMASLWMEYTHLISTYRFGGMENNIFRSIPWSPFALGSARCTREFLTGCLYEGVRLQDPLVTRLYSRTTRNYCAPHLDLYSSIHQGPTPFKAQAQPWFQLPPTGSTTLLKLFTGDRSIQGSYRHQTMWTGVLSPDITSHACSYRLLAF
jgi:hypothetical protein